MIYRNRCYLRKHRLAAVREAAGRQPLRRRRKRAFRLVLGGLIFGAFLWNAGIIRRLSGWFGSLIQVESVQERSLLEGGGFGPGPGEMGEGPVVREGINILLDERAISIFRIRDSREQVND